MPPAFPPARASPARAGRRPLLLAVTAAAAACCLAAALLAGRAAIAGQTRPPTPAERAAAAAAAVAQRWRSWPAGRIFPADLRYTTTLHGPGTAHRVGISPDYRCAAALDAVLARPAHREGCQAGIRASYVDELGGVVYTTGVLAFPDRARAAAFARQLPSARPPVAALRALALPGTASARFTAAARQTSTARQDGPFVVLTVAGYADGRPAAVTGEFDAPAFSAAGQLATRDPGPAEPACRGQLRPPAVVVLTGPSRLQAVMAAAALAWLPWLGGHHAAAAASRPRPHSPGREPRSAWPSRRSSGPSTPHPPGG